MLERLLEIEVTEDGMIIEELELICSMTGFRLRLLIAYTTQGVRRAVELGPR